MLIVTLARNNRRSKLKRGAFNIANKIFPVVKAAAGPVAFIEQITCKDRATLGATFSNAGTATQAKILVNIILGRVAGITVFRGGLPSAPQTINPAGVINKWTNAGLIGIAYGILGKQINKMVGTPVVPATGKVKSIGKGVLIGGALGGFFDPPEGSSHGSNPTGHFPSLQAAPQLRNISGRTSFSVTDSSLSGMA